MGWSNMDTAAPFVCFWVTTRLLLDYGADVNVKMVGGFTPAYIAAERNHCDILKTLVAARASLEIGTDRDGATPMYVAAASGHTDACKLLSWAGANLNATTTSGVTPFAAACKNVRLWFPPSRPFVLWLLLCKDHVCGVAKGESCVTLVNCSLCRFSQGRATTALALARTNGFYKASVEAADTAGNTPLHFAAANGFLTVVNLLVEKLNAKLEVENAAGKTPCQVAMDAGHVEVVEYLARRARRSEACSVM